MNMKFLTVLTVSALLTSSAFAGNKYFTHQKIKSGAKNPIGEWSIDYVQLLPLGGKKLSAQQKEVNALLKAQAEDAVPQASDAQYGKSSVNINTNVTFVSPRLLAIDVQYDYYYAGAAHPSAGMDSTIFDLSIGKRIALSTGLPVGEFGEKQETPEFKALITDKLIAASLADIGMDESCRELYTKEQLEFINVSLSPKAISVSPSLPHAAMACYMSVSIPMSELKAVAKPGSLLAELVKGAQQ